VARPDPAEPAREPNQRVSHPDAAEPAREPTQRVTRPDPAERARSRRRLAEVFGEVLPETTGDDRPELGAPADAEERWYNENRPPHHDPR
jgi:hypothetical protein